MKPAPIPSDEEERLNKLRSYGVLDTEAEASFDRITRIVAESLDVPISLVSLVDESRQWFKSRYGLDAEETPRELAFCAHAIHSDDLFCVTNAKDDDRFHDNPLVSGGPNIRFYAGVPLVTSDGFRLGTLCAIDDKARDISEDHRQLLIDLANLVVDELELKKTRRELSEEIALRDRFFSIIAHDLKSPLSSLLGLSHFLSVMSEKLTKEKMAEIAGNVHMSGMRVLALVENLLEWAQLQTEKDQVSPEIIPVSSLLDECLGLIQNLAHQKKSNCLRKNVTLISMQTRT